MASIRASTKGQYESGWKKFQQFVSSTDVTEITPSVPLDFAAALFHSEPFPCPSTVANAMAAIKDPLWFGFGVVADARAWKMFQQAFFLQRPGHVRSPALWSLPKVLRLLESPCFTASPTPLDVFRKALFLVALASGLWLSQLAAMVRGPAFLRFGPGDAYVSLAPYPRFLAKNERRRHRLSPVTVHAWSRGSRSHPLCPVAALRAYVRVSPGDALRLWVNPVSARVLRAKGLASVLTKVIVEADPGARPRAHQIRSYSSSLAFFRTFDLDSVAAAGQWASPSVFVSRYLNPLLSDVPCVVMGGFPQPRQADGSVGGEGPPRARGSRGGSSPAVE